MEVSQKTKNKTTTWPSNSTPGYTYSKKMKTLIKKDTCTSKFSVIVYNCQFGFGHNLSVHQQMNGCRMDIEGVVHIYSGILLNPKKKKEWKFAICNNMDGLGGYYAEISETEKDKYCMISLICGI